MAPSRLGDGSGGHGSPPFDDDERHVDDLIKILEEQLKVGYDASLDPGHSLIDELNSALTAMRTDRDRMPVK